MWTKRMQSLAEGVKMKARTGLRTVGVTMVTMGGGHSVISVTIGQQARAFSCALVETSLRR